MKLSPAGDKIFWMNTEHLTREQRNALQTLLDVLPKIRTYTQNCDKLQKYAPLLPSNFIAASMDPIHKTSLPRELNWSWNQSNAKVVVNISDQTSVVFRKLSTKTNANTSVTAPSCKIWLYEIQTMWENPLYLLWCEKGVEEETKGIVTEIGTIYPERISTESLSFLSPFVENELAEELGWKSN